MDKKEKGYLIAFFCSLIVLALIAVISFIYAAGKIYQEGSMNNNVLELFYLGIHFVILVTAILFCKNALTKGSYIMRTLMYSRYGRRSIFALVLTATFFFINCAVFVYFAAVLFGSGWPSFNFPITLIIDLVNTPLTAMVICFFFFGSTFVFPYHNPLEDSQPKE